MTNRASDHENCPEIIINVKIKLVLG
jgi:hypothetical protein